MLKLGIYKYNSKYWKMLILFNLKSDTHFPKTFVLGASRKSL